MFCSKCGKPTENNQPICNDCLQAMNGAQAQPQQQAYQQPYQAYQQPQYQQPYYAPQPPKAPALTKPSLAKSIVSLALSSVALIAMYIVLIEALTYYDYYYRYFDTTYYLVMTFIFVAPAVISIVFGAKSIGGSTMVLADRTTKKHIPTLIFGIVGLIQGILAALMCFITLILCMTA